MKYFHIICPLVLVIIIAVFTTPYRIRFDRDPKDYRGMTFKKDIFSTQYTSDGYRYTLSESTYCGREEPPVINSHTIISPLGDFPDRQAKIDFLVREYYKHNGREDEKKLPKEKALQAKTK